MRISRDLLILAATVLVPFTLVAQEEIRLHLAEPRQSTSARDIPLALTPAGGRFVLSADQFGRLDFDPVLAAALLRALDSVRAQQGTRGMSGAVLVPGQGVWQGVSGVSSLNPTVAVDPSMLFGIGSNTKAFVSTTILSLVDSGLISLDAPLSAYLPPLPNVQSAVTIRQLLNMTSGLFDYLNDSNAQGDSVEANPTRYWTPEELISTFVGPPKSAPGGAYRYCNTNYVLLGMVISSVTGRPVSAQIRRSVLARLSLDHTFLEVEEPYGDPVAHPWDSGVDFSAIPVTAHFTTLWTAGGIMSTAENMARWVKALYEGAVVSPASRQAMLSTVPMSSSAAPGLEWTGYGLGIRQGTYYGMPFLGHGGSVMGYVSHTGYIPRNGVSFAVLTNTSEASATRAMTALMDAYLRTVPARPAAPGTWYAISGKPDSTRLYVLDHATGALSPVGSAQYGTLVGVRIHPHTGNAWGLTNAAGWELVQVDGVTGQSFPRKQVKFPAGAPTDLRGVDFAPDGTLCVGAVDGRVYAIDVATGSAVLVTTTRFPVSGLAFEPSTGALWASPRTSPVFRDRVYRILLPGGDTVGVGNTGFTQTLTDIAFDARGNLFGLAGNPSTPINYRLARIDKGTGLGTEVGSLGLSGMVGIAYCPAASETAVGPALAAPAGIDLEQNYPNPFNGVSEVGFHISGFTHVQLRVCDLLGREVAVLVNEWKAPGHYVAQFNASSLASGVYVCRLTAGPAVMTRKMILAR